MNDLPGELSKGLLSSTSVSLKDTFLKQLLAFQSCLIFSTFPKNKVEHGGLVMYAGTLAKQIGVITGVITNHNTMNEPKL